MKDNSMIKGILFDLDGVLFDTETYDTKILYDYLDLINSPLPKERLNYLICPNREIDFVNEMLKGYVAKEDQEEFMRKMKEYSFSHRQDRSYKKLMFKEVPDTLQWLKDNDYKIACVSSATNEYISKALIEAEITEYFDIIVSGDNFDKNKPAPDCYLFSAKQLGLTPKECLVIEDSYNGILSGKNANMLVFARKEYSLGLNQSGADYYGDDYSSLIQLIKEKNKQ